MSKKLKDEIKTLDENWKRALADYQNLVRRVESDKREVVRFASSNLVSRLIPTLDILELAANHTQDQGIRMAVKQFQDVLAGEGLQEISPLPGDEFDPSFHECIETLSLTDDAIPNTIAEIVRKGYKIDDNILRPAKVKVYSKNKEENL